jgi:hypothetical protein
VVAIAVVAILRVLAAVVAVLSRIARVPDVQGKPVDVALFESRVAQGWSSDAPGHRSVGVPRELPLLFEDRFVTRRELDLDVWRGIDAEVSIPLAK